MATNMKEAFHHSLAVIWDSLREKFQDKSKEIEEDLNRKSTKVAKLQDRLSVVEKSIKQLNEEKNKLQLQISNSNPRIAKNFNDLPDQYRVSNVFYERNYDITEMQAKVAVAVSKSKEWINYMNWLKIKENFQHMFNLAITAKQQQGIVLQLQNTVDRHALGIDMPSVFKIDKIKINNGMIVLNNALPSY